MPGFTCCVPGCYNNSHRDRELRFYTFPKDQTQREIWLKNISRAGVSGCFSTFQPTTGHRVCSVHFPGGRKTYTIRVPTLFPLRGVNERKSRRGRNKKLFAALPGSVPGVVTGAVPGEGEGNGETTVVQIGQNGQYITPVDLTAAGNAADHSEDFVGAGASGRDGAGSCAGAGAGSCAGLSGEDHCYSLTNGTTSAELLRKLNEQRDIIALMEVKMKEMKNTIRQLRITEAQLQEELRERDRLLSAASTTAATASSSSTSPSSSSSVRKKV
ncbi:THAP domain-containing protein 11 [Astyanax mexicanus]|uniref:THAP domain-containing protein 11 n=1 Tax=Astyanax mexicanus TaxID=7994 RepID=A0A8T2L883_ASTMX|nr:THAP domain-containing protein 11 [Astyanax mexicanus]